MKQRWPKRKSKRLHECSFLKIAFRFAIDITHILLDRNIGQSVNLNKKITHGYFSSARDPK